MTPAEFARMVNGLHAFRPDWPWHEIAAETQRMADYDFAAVSRACLAEALNPGAKWPSALGHLGVNPRAATSRRPSEEPTCSLHERLQPCGSCAADLLAATPDEVERRRAERPNGVRSSESDGRNYPSGIRAHRAVADRSTATLGTGNGHLDEPTTKENVA